MTTGTKVFLTIFAVLVGLLVLYYGVLMPAGAPDLAVDTSAENAPESASMTPSPVASDPLREAPTEPVSRPTMLDDGIDRGRLATAGDATGSPAAIRPVDPASTRVLGTDALGTEVQRPGPLNDPTRAGATSTPPSAGPQDALAAGPTASPGSGSPAAVGATEGPRANVGAVIQPGSPVARPSSGAPARGPLTSPPARTAAPPAGRDPLNYTNYVVRDGDTLSDIALEWYGDPSQWHLIAQANPTVDPLRMAVGQTLRLPPRDGRTSTARMTATRSNSPAGGQIVYVVQPGDTLSSIARSYYGETARWRTVYDANRRTIGAQPDRLKIGMRLVIPPPFPSRDRGG